MICILPRKILDTATMIFPKEYELKASAFDQLKGYRNSGIAGHKYPRMPLYVPR